MSKTTSGKLTSTVYLKYTLSILRVYSRYYEWHTYLQPGKLICTNRHATTSSYGMYSAVLYTWPSQISIQAKV